MSNLEHSSSNTSDSESDTEDARPNRWTGPPSTWQALTEPERELAASLDVLRNADLSVHLFNAHALKRRARELEGPEGSSKSISEFPSIPEEDQAFRPPKGWTAWPLPPEDVPRTGEQVGPAKPFEEYTYKAEVDGAPSQELEDALMGVTLRFAKERFESREEAIEEAYTDKGKGKAQAGREEDMNSRGSEFRDSSDEEEPVSKEASKFPEANVRMKPVVSADDDRSRELLRPSIRHTLSKLDEVLMALHHARKTCHRYSHSEAGTTDDESIADTALSSQAPSLAQSQLDNSPTKRPKGRPRKFANLPSRSKADANVSPSPSPQKAGFEAGDPLRPKQTHLGRPKKVYKRLDGETQEDYLVRVARLQKKPLPAFAPPPEPKSPKSPSPSTHRGRSPVKKATEDELRDSRRKKLGLRDWSEVLGMAALVGFDEGVVERAVKRCANLFGEGMVMRKMQEIPFAERGGSDTLVKYEPELIPDLNEHALQLSSSDDDGEEGSESEVDSEPSIKPGMRTKSMPSRQAVFCPIQTCPRRVQGFRDMAAVRRHLERGHKINREEVEDYILPSDEEMDGAVHVDGFLKLAKRVHAPRGRYRKEKKRNRVDSGDADDDEEDEGVVIDEELGARQGPKEDVSGGKSGGDST